MATMHLHVSSRSSCCRRLLLAILTQQLFAVQDPAIAGSISRIQTEENVAKEQAAAEEAARLAAIEAKKAGRLAAQVPLAECRASTQLQGALGSQPHHKATVSCSSGQ